jgi:hypothetical protein
VPVTQSQIAQLVGQVYADAPTTERTRMLAQLIRPLGVLSLVAVANGVFATIRFRSAWSEITVLPEDAQNVAPSDVISLANHVQQVSSHAIDGLADLLATSPLLAGSAAAAILISLLVQRSRNRRADDRIDV